MGSSEPYQDTPGSPPVADPASQPAGGDVTGTTPLGQDATPATADQSVTASATAEEPVEAIQLHLPQGLVQELRSKAAELGKDVTSWIHEELHKLAGGGSTPA